jgi:type I restriction enzyme S subunit
VAALNCCFSNFMQRLRPSRSLASGFLWRLLNCPVGRKQLVFWSTTTTGLGNLNGTILGECRFGYPPLPEQLAIVRFIDYTDRRIRRYIRAKQRLIKLLDEQKQAIVHRAVTRGLDPNVRLKPSGVEWLGDVPEHWEVLPLRRRWTVTDCKHLTVPFLDAGIPLASVREVQSFDVQLDHANRTSEDWYRVLIEGDRQPRRGDLIYCRNVSVGAAAVVETDETLAMGQDVCLIRSRRQSQRFLNYFLKSPAMDRQLALLKVGSTFDRINVAEVKNLLVAIPPPEEQQLIASVLDERISVSERAKNRSRSEQDLIQEFRARLIADVVTGKVDVREASVALAEVDDPRFHSDEVDQDPIPDIDDDDRMQSGDRDDDHDRDDPEES